MRTLLATALLGLMLALSPLALAQDSNESKDETPPQRPDDAAWTEDCPPDMMCAFGGGENASEDEKPTYDGNCGGEVCAYGDEQCIECSGPVSSDDGATCMDGQQDGEACRDDVQYLDGRGPADCENCRGDAGEPEVDPISAPADGSGGDAGVTNADDAAKNVPLPAVLVVVAVLAAAVLVVRRA